VPRRTRGAGRLYGRIGNTSAVYPVQYGVLKDFEAVSLLTNGPSCAAV